MALRAVDELPFAVGWLDDEDPLARASHALGDGDGVWLVDPLDLPGAAGLWERLGRPLGVLQLLGHHNRDVKALAARLGVPHYHVPRGPVDGAPFEFRPVRLFPGWKEAALWWPERRTLVTADALGTVGYIPAPGERIGVHPIVRFRPPRGLAGLPAEHILCGHGAGIHGPGTAAELARAIRQARRRLPSAWLGAARYWRRRS